MCIGPRCHTSRMTKCPLPILSFPNVISLHNTFLVSCRTKYFVAQLRNSAHTSEKDKFGQSFLDAMHELVIIHKMNLTVTIGRQVVNLKIVWNALVLEK